MRIHTLLIAAGILNAGFSHAALIANYEFNTPLAAGGTLEDRSGNGYNATQQTYSSASTGHATSVIAGTYGSITIGAADAASFGTAYQGDANPAYKYRINEAGATAISATMNPGGGSMTFMSWVYGGHGYLFSNGSYTNGWAISITEGQELRFTANGVAHLISDRALILHSWNHVAVTVSGTAVSFYINGNQASVQTIPDYNIETNDASIGGIPELTASTAFTGKADNLRIYDKALSADEIRLAAVPEPSSYALLGAGTLAAVSVMRRRRRLA